MEFFPQLETGALVQYPLRKRIDTRTVLNRSLDGTQVKLFEGGATRLLWELHYSGLTAQEVELIESLFHSVEGRLGSFTWLDPTGNLLASSEEFDAPSWISGPLVSHVGGGADPLGGTAAYRITNAAQISQDIEQSIAASGRFSYCFSIWARSDSLMPLTLSARTSSTTSSIARTATAGWSRITFSVHLDVPEEQITFAISLPAGGAADLFGAQVDAQPEPSPYKRTAAAGAVYTAARFDQDALSVQADGRDSHRTSLQIVTTTQE